MSVVIVEDPIVVVAKLVVPVKVVTPVNVGPFENTANPPPSEPVSSVKSAASFAELSSDELEIFPVKVFQSAKVKRPRAAVAAEGILSCTAPPSATDAIFQLISEPVEPVEYVVVAVVRPLLPRVPVRVGAKVMVFPVAVIKSVILSPLKAVVDDASVIVGPL